MRSTCLLIAAMLIVAPPPGQAQESNTKGFVGNLHYSRTTLKSDQDGAETDQGNGFGGRVGWGFSPNFTVYLGLEAAKLIIEGDGAGGDYGLGHLDLGLTYNFANANRALVPYLEGAVGARAIAYSTIGGDIQQLGASFTLGGGINYFFSGSTALQVGLNVTGGTFQNAKLDGDEIPGSDMSASGARLMVGVTYSPMKR
ncbi:MAG: outer membrane beta-barrel protein [Gemmatimonadaceae bacterium]